ncbi:hypothetical protein SAMN05444358_101136 [Ruegeria halocynthiae]|uniref:Uncharacterized protein n=1 Tax=Ruegeria halocynthiae TaxID=985054 RepID=A0A1H2RF52_9RHOB|nr:hypothetical protein [Ruegeria halocynthiae]SDW17848.1 hypothetical protein SAMN05444358_101136 [Ruegeria halocynthiae]
MPSLKNEPGFNHNSMKARLGLANRTSDTPERPKPETTEITAQRNAAAAFGVGHGGAGRDKQNVKKDERSARRDDIESRLGISLGDKPAPQNSSSNIARAFGGTRSR